MKKNRNLKAYSFFFSFLSLALFLFPRLSAAEEFQRGPGNDYFQQALVSISEGSHEEAEENFKKALDAEPMNPEYHFERANFYAMQHDESEQIGDSLGADRKMQQAASDLERAVMVKPEFLPAHFNLGVVYKKLGKYEAARKEFKEVLRLDPSQTAARMQIGATYEDQGFYDEAETIYKEIGEQYPESPGVYEALNGLSQRRIQARHDESAERGMRMNALSGGLSSLSRGGDMYGANASQQSAGVGQAIPYLGQWALQQFMKGKREQ